MLEWGALCLKFGKHYGFEGASQVVPMVKNLPANAGDTRDKGLIPGSGKIPWRRNWEPTPAFLPGESQGQRSLAGVQPQWIQGI